MRRKGLPYGAQPARRKRDRERDRENAKRNDVEQDEDGIIGALRFKSMCENGKKEDGERRE